MLPRENWRGGVCDEYYWTTINIKLPNETISDKFITYNDTFIRFKEWISFSLEKERSKYRRNKDLFMDKLNSEGISISRWLLQDCVILSHNNENGEINLIIQPDRCVTLY